MAKPVVEKGPKFPVHMILLATMFVLREVEAANARVSHVIVDRGEKQAHWRLPATKTDYKELGTSRTWGCICSRAMRIAYCPFCLMVNLLAMIGTAGGGGDDPYLFATIAGNMPTKKMVIQTLNFILTGAVLTIFTGHAFRVAGAQHLAALGMDMAMIQLLGRWDSSLVRRYVAEAPLLCLTQKHRAFAQTKTTIEDLQLRAHGQALTLPDFVDHHQCKDGDQCQGQHDRR